MDKTFEERLADIQGKMILACMDYAGNRAERIYIYASREGSSINGQVVERHKLGEGFDVSPKRQFACLGILRSCIHEAEDMCKGFGKDMPRHAPDNTLLIIARAGLIMLRMRKVLAVPGRTSDGYGEIRMADRITVGCLREDLAVCPGCGSRNIVGRDREYCHCGQCGQALEIRLVSKVAAAGEETGEQKEFEQMSLF